MNIITDTYTATDERYYLVTEEWPDQPFDAKTYWEYMFVPSQKIFKKNTWEESKKEAEFYYARRLKEIRIRKLMFPAVDKKHFTLILSYAESEVDIGQKEFVIQVTHEHNLPYDEDFKNGLFRVKEVPPLQEAFLQDSIKNIQSTQQTKEVKSPIVEAIKEKIEIIKQENRQGVTTMQFDEIENKIREQILNGQNLLLEIASLKELLRVNILIDSGIEATTLTIDTEYSESI